MIVDASDQCNQVNFAFGADGSTREYDIKGIKLNYSISSFLACRYFMLKLLQ